MNYNTSNPNLPIMIAVNPMHRYVADSVALIFRLEQKRLGIVATSIFLDVEQNQALLIIPAIVLAEILYLSERNRIVATLQDVRNYMDRFSSCQEQPLTFDIIATAESITDIPELHDRLIVATAVYLSAPVITKDAKISHSIHVQTIW